MSPPFTEASRVGLIRVLKSINLLNCILITVSIIFTYGFLFPRLDTDVTFVSPRIIKKNAEKDPLESLKTQTLSPQEYRVIADQNLFHPDRIIPPEKKPESVLPKPEFVLFGTLITPDLKMAYMEDKKAPVSTPGRGQRQTALKIGESLSGFNLKEVMADKVVMTRGEETIQVLLQEPGSSKGQGNNLGSAGAQNAGSGRRYTRSKPLISPAGYDYADTKSYDSKSCVSSAFRDSSGASRPKAYSCRPDARTSYPGDPAGTTQTPRFLKTLIFLNGLD